MGQDKGDGRRETFAVHYYTEFILLSYILPNVTVSLRPDCPRHQAVATVCTAWTASPLQWE